MNLFTRMIRSIQESAVLDRGFETYYGALVRSQATGGPTAAEARRDFMATRVPIERAGMF